MLNSPTSAAYYMSFYLQEGLEVSTNVNIRSIYISRSGAHNHKYMIVQYMGGSPGAASENPV